MLRARISNKQPTAAVWRSSLVGVAVVLLLGCASGRRSKKQQPAPQKGRLTVEIVYPGASPAEVEALVTRPVEETLGAIVGIGPLSSASSEGRALITASVRVKDQTRVLGEARSRLSELRTLPVSAERPRVFFGAQPQALLLVAITGPAHHAGATRTALQVREQLQRLPGVSHVRVHGLDNQRLLVEVDTIRLRQYGLTAHQVLQEVRRSSSTAPGGRVRSVKGAPLIRVTPQVESLGSLGRLLIRTGGPGTTAVRLSSVASLRMESDPARTLYSDQGEGVLLVVAVSPGHSTTKLDQQVRRVVSQALVAASGQARFCVAGPLHTSREPLPQAGVAWDHVLRGPVLVFTARPRPDVATASGRAGVLPRRLLEATRVTLGIRNVSCVLVAPRPLLPTPSGHDRIQVMAFLSREGYATAAQLAGRWRAQLQKDPALRALQLSGPGRSTTVVLSHPDSKTLKRATTQLVTALKGRPGIHQSAGAGAQDKPELRIALSSKGRAAGLTAAHLTDQLRAYAGGVVASTLQRGRSSIPILFRASVRLRAKTVGRVWIQTPGKALVPLSQVASIQWAAGPQRILHHAQKRVSYVTFNGPGKQVPAAAYRPLLEALRRDYPGLLITVRH